MASGDSRVVAGKWRMGETLGKGGYSWVKKGTNINNEEEQVALKFTLKDASKWSAQDQETIDTEVKALTQLTKEDHPNIMKILEWNMDCAYPNKSGKLEKTILFVLELATGGELFDILFYTGKLTEEEGRTYFAQLIDGLEHLHSNGICHRDIKPQNLLLSGDFVLKITDFGLSKVMESESDTTMRTKVGTRGYQAPEQLLNQPYTVSADIFAAGVVLFVLMAGYPPFEHARKNDPWYKQLIPKKPGAEPKFAKFWKAHRAAGLSAQTQDFINNLLAFDPHKRFSIEQIREHPWFNGKKLSVDELNASLSRRVADVHRGRLSDAEKQAEQNYSIKRRGVKALMADFDAARVAPAYATATRQTMFDFRTKAHPDALLKALNEYVTSACRGVAEVDNDNYRLKALINTANQELEFQACVYNDADAGENIVSIKRLSGGFVEYGKIYNMVMEQSLYPVKARWEADAEAES